MAGRPVLEPVAWTPGTQGIWPIPPAILHQADATERAAIVRSDGGRPVGNVPRPERASRERRAKQCAEKKVCPSGCWANPQGACQGTLRPWVGQSLHPRGMRRGPGNARRVSPRVPARPESLRVPQNCHRESVRGGVLAHGAGRAGVGVGIARVHTEHCDRGEGAYKAR